VTTPTGAPPSGLAPGGDGTAWHALSADSVLSAEQVDEREGLSLDVQQWLVCICVGLAIVVVSEIRKAIRRRAAGPVPAGPESPAEG
jgi:hypothetical protein